MYEFSEYTCLSFYLHIHQTYRAYILDEHVYICIYAYIYVCGHMNAGAYACPYLHVQHTYGEYILDKHVCMCI